MRYALLATLALAASTGAAVFARGAGAFGSTVLIAAYAAGCALAVLAVGASGIVLAMAQPPLILLIALAIAQAVDHRPDGVAQLAVDTGVTLIGDFPLMAAVTAGALTVGFVRLRRLRARARPATDSDPRPEDVALR